MKAKLFIITLVFFIAACSDHIETKVVDVIALRASNIYNRDSIFAYTEKYKDVNKDLAESYKKQSSESNNKEKAIYFAKRAVTIHPTLENYLFLAKRFEENEKYKELTEVYQLIVDSYYYNEDKRLFPKPTEEIYYNYIVYNIIASGNLWEDQTYMLEELGYDKAAFKEKLIKEERIKMDRESEAFKLILLQFLPYDQIEQYVKQKEVFDSFLKTVPESDFHFSINDIDIQEFNYNAFNGSDYNEMQTPLSSVYVYYTQEKQEDKEHWVDYNFLRQFKLSPSVVALEYAIDSSELACPKEMRHIYHRIVTYDVNTMKIIDSKVTAFQSGGELATVEFYGKGFSITYSTRKFKKPYDKKQFDNELLSTELVSREHYLITDTGKIEESTAPN